MHDVAMVDFDIRSEETKTLCPWCKGSGKRDVIRHVDLKKTLRYMPVVICEACKGEGQVTASECKRLVKSISGTRRIGE